MNVKSKRNRIFGACLLLMMSILAVCTVVFATGDSSSYSLVIKKDFDFEAVPAHVRDFVKQQAQDQKYTFKIQGTKKVRKTIDGVDRWVDEKLEEEVVLPRTGEDGQTSWESKVYSGDGPFDVTVTELTDNIDISDSNGNHYNMSNSSSDTSVRVNNRKHEVQLRNNSTLTIKRPEVQGTSTGPKKLWYHVTNRLYNDHEKPGGYKSVDEVFSLEAGEKKSLEKLSAAIYTIEQIAAPDGYQVQMGERKAQVDSGKDGIFYINGTPGILTLTAGGKKDDGALHYYTIDRTKKEEGDTSEFVKRTVSVASGESYVLDNLPKGGYTIKEYTIDASEAFAVTVPQTSKRTKTGKSSALTSETASNWKYMDLAYSNFDVDYIKMVSFGPLYNSSEKKLNSSTSYAVFRYGVASDDGTKITNIRTHSQGFRGDLTYNVTNAPEIRMNACKRLYFTATGVKSNTAKKLGVSWTEFDEKETEKTFKQAGIQESVTVDSRKWIEIAAPALPDPNAPGADQIIYYYTVKDKDGKLVQGDTGDTDRNDTTVKLLPGESKKLQLPDAGSYTVAEGIVGNTSVGFSMKVAGYPFGTTEAGKEIKVQVGGERTVTISKPALGSHPDGSEDTRNYVFRVSGGGFSEEGNVKAGESVTITLPKEGTYTITPQNDTLEVYEMSYKDSGAIYGTASGSTGTITFTNAFKKGACGYRYIHEYYVKESDGTYTHEGNSQITTRLGRDEGETYDSRHISYAPNFEENTYEHFDEAYGWVDPIEPGAQTKSRQAETDRELPVDSAGGSDEDAGGKEREASDKMASDNIDDKEGAAPDDSTSDAAEDGGQEPSEDGMPDAADNGESAISEDKVPDAAEDGETGLTGENMLDSADQSGAASSGRDVPDGADSKEPENDGDGGNTHVTDDEKQEAAGKNMPDAASGEEKQLSEDESGGNEGAAHRKSRSEESHSGNGIVTAGVGEALNSPNTKDTTTISYRPDSAKDYIDVTEDATQIIILRYYRERQPAGKYNVIHVYYCRDADGDKWEGTSGVQVQDGELGIKYVGDDVEKVYNFQPEGAERPHAYEWDKRPQYGVVEKTSAADGNEFAGNGKVYRPNNAWKAAEGTEEGNQIIILRYYREPGKEGNYNIIHEYYSRESTGSEGTEMKDAEPGRAAQPQSEESETGGSDEDTSDIFTGTLDRSRDDSYVYNFEGCAQMESVAARLGTTHTEDTAGRKPTYGKKEYTYMEAGYGTKSDDENYSCNPNQQWAASTEQGDDVIILRYVREADDTLPELSYKVVHEYYVRDKKGTQTLVGTSDIRKVTDAVYGIHYTQEHVGRELVFKGDTYTYFDWGCGTASEKDYSEVSGKRYVLATESGEQIIILRYVLEDSQGDPETPPDEDPKPPSDEPKPPSRGSDKPSKGSGSPGKAGGRKGSAGKTGDNNQIIFWAVLAEGSLCGLAAREYFFKKRRWKRYRHRRKL